MSKVLVSDKYLTNIANAIRNKNGQNIQYKPSEMAEAINSLSNISTSPIQYNITITQSAHQTIKLKYAYEPEKEVSNSFTLSFNPKIISGIVTADIGYKAGNLKYSNNIITNIAPVFPIDVTSDLSFYATEAVSYPSVDLSYYMLNNVSNYYSITEIPQQTLEYLSSGIRATNMAGMFTYCNELTNVPKIENIITSNVTNMSSMFASCNSLISVDISNFDTSNVTTMNSMFSNCINLTTIIGTIDMRSCNNFYYMFDKCAKLQNVRIKNPPINFDGAGLQSNQYTIVN